MSTEQKAAPLSALTDERTFPIQRYPRRIPWAVAEKAYEYYHARWPGQTLERIAERGGFGIGEMDTFHPTWRNEVDLIPRLQAALKQEVEKRRELEQEVEESNSLLSWKDAEVRESRQLEAAAQKKLEEWGNLTNRVDQCMLSSVGEYQKRIFELENQLATSAQTLEQNSAALEAAVAEKENAWKGHRRLGKALRDTEGELQVATEHIALLESRLSLAVEVAAEKQREACAKSCDDAADYPDDERLILNAPAPAFDAVMEEVDRRLNDGK